MSGTVFALTFTFTALVVGFTADKISKSSFGRHRLMAIGVLVFSTSCLLTGFSSAYWHLVILRVGIAAGEEKNLLIDEDNRRPLVGKKLFSSLPLSNSLGSVWDP